MALIFDRAVNHRLLDGRTLHSGNGLEVRIGRHRLPVRVEYEDRVGWVLLVGEGARILPGLALPARAHPGDGRC